MPTGSDDDDRPERAGGRGSRPQGGGRPRSDRARRADDDRRTGGRSDRRPGAGQGSGGRKGDGRDEDRRRPGAPGGDQPRGRRRDAAPPARGGARGRTGDPGAREGRSRGRATGERPGRRGEDEPRERPPRPPVKGRRRTFDIDSTPNERERERLEGGGGPTEERWIDEGPVRRAADAAVNRGARGAGPRPAPEPAERTSGSRSTQRRAQRAAKRAEQVLQIDRDRMRRRLGAARAERTIARIGEATAAFSEDRYEDVRRILKPITALIPEEPVVHELHGLALYRLGRWRKAAAELEEFQRLTGSTEQHPVLADCYRALGQHERVEELWEEIGEASLAAPLVAEGRIVYAGSLADRGRLADAIGILEVGALGSGSALKDHHLRMRYVLGDLTDRAGDHQSARRWFESIAKVSPAFFDVQDRLRQL